jgi:enoyl-CoA hydratase
LSSTDEQAVPVRVTIEGRVARATIDNQPARNALSPPVITGLEQAIRQTSDAGCHVLVVRGAGGNLSSGADLRHLRSIQEDPAGTRQYIASIGEALDALEAAPFISVCVVDGYALAGGCELLLAADLSVASTTAQIGDRHLEYGLLPGAGGSVRMSRALPPAFARRLLYTGEIISGSDAAAAGLVSLVAPPENLETAVNVLVERLSSRPLDALQHMKLLHRMAVLSEPRAALDNEREVLLAHLPGSTVREGLEAFATHRTPVFAADTLVHTTDGDTT